MGLLTAGKEKAVARQKKSIESEADAAGCAVLDVVDLSANGNGTGGVVTGILKDIFGGKSAVDSVYLFRMKRNRSEFWYFQPFDGLSPLPGEFHEILDVVIPGPAVLREIGIFSKRKWTMANESEFEKLLNTRDLMKSAAKQIEWSWKSGFTSIDLKWTVQLRPVDGTRTHLVMKTGRYGGFTSYNVGFAVYLSLGEAIRKSVGGEKFEGASAFIEPTMFGHVFDNYIETKGS
ncbi:MAG: hypothetical protein EPN93_20195 [Spirochaetes bacterium]|nr:MAG: hypothetical protein EPN93_20195 [Spirochaetota bacterium]